MHKYHGCLPDYDYDDETKLYKGHKGVTQCKLVGVYD